MTSDKIYVSVSLEPDQDWPVADLIYDGTHWASATLRDGEIVLTVYGDDTGNQQIPIDDMIVSLDRARRQLAELLD